MFKATPNLLHSFRNLYLCVSCLYQVVEQLALLSCHCQVPYTQTVTSAWLYSDYTDHLVHSYCTPIQDHKTQHLALHLLFDSIVAGARLIT